MGDTIRIGRVSSVSGSYVRVTYPDRSDTVTAQLPVLGNGVYRIPSVGELVAVAHFSNGEADGICLGGLSYSNNDCALSAMYARFQSAEDRITALEERVRELGG